MALDFLTGSRTTTTVPLSEPESGKPFVHEGTPVVLELWWPDHPSVRVEQQEWLHTMRLVRAELTTATGEDRTDVDPKRAATLLAAQEASLRAYAAKLVKSWSVPMPCTVDAVLETFARIPSALEQVIAASGEDDRFLPASLRRSTSEPAPSSEAVG